VSDPEHEKQHPEFFLESQTQIIKATGSANAAIIDVIALTISAMKA
jgi:hypothetical protein